MNSFMMATKVGLRFQTSRGLLGVEDLWKLPMTALVEAIRAVKKELGKDDDTDLDFLDKTKTKNPEMELRFNVLKEVYIERTRELEEKAAARASKEHKEKILRIIEKKRDAGLEEMTVEQLEKLIAD